MATYAYACRACRQVFETVRSIHDAEPPEMICPGCDSTETVRTFSAPGLVFKSKGFYSTDNRKSS
jgi:putative FmdB family regulatory protein